VEIWIQRGLRVILGLMPLVALAMILGAYIAVLVLAGALMIVAVAVGHLMSDDDPNDV
jgi:hypothetical protein